MQKLLLGVILLRIYKGDNGVVLRFTILDDGIEVDLTGATIEGVIQTKTKRIIKPANIIDAITGKVDIILNSDDLTEVGRHNIQIIVNFHGGNKYSSDIKSFYVSGTL